jgi:hypothetical protein
MVDVLRQIPDELKETFDRWAATHDRPYAPRLRDLSGNSYTPGQIAEAVRADSPRGHEFAEYYFDFLYTPNLFALETIQRETEKNMTHLPNNLASHLGRGLRNIRDFITYQTPVGAILR